MNEQQNQTYRMLSMYDRLKQGQTLCKKDEAATYQVSEKTIQRDIDGIRHFLETSKTNQYLEYVRRSNVYKLEADSQDFLQSEEILAMTKILIESRAFPKEDMEQLLLKLIDLAPTEDKVLIRKLLLNEQHLYVDLQHKKSLFYIIWDLAKAVHLKRSVKMEYTKELAMEVGVRTIQPVGLIFSDYYFYLLAYSSNDDLDLPKIYRIDRITNYKVLDEQFKIPYRDRFQEGEFRKRIQFMHAGELMTIQFRYKGPSPQAVLDRLPTARVVKEESGSLIYEAEVFGRGVKMWLFSQGESVEVLKPLELREEMKRSVSTMLVSYVLEDYVRGD
ncbi:helix-turn-helix transcriptional regulator [Sporosarcina luteola]|uniref:helix-turn-helix transcriptional regulator n=1 Tax=Sporosarcina luteola TaxID=582850 RepID=UPI0011BE8F7A|nr:WYL domain-containing protein [Sporosarcina luteola]